MAKRPAHEKSKHDRKVRQIADRLDRKGWRVRADVTGYPTPDSRGQRSPRIPDVVARKKGATKIIEVETKSTRGRDARQHSVFRRSAAQQSRTTFQIVMA